jgi:hypothetical protein
MWPMPSTKEGFVSMSDLPQSTVEAMREALHALHVNEPHIPPMDRLARVALQAALDEGDVVLKSELEQDEPALVTKAQYDRLRDAALAFYNEREARMDAETYRRARERLRQELER